MAQSLKETEALIDRLDAGVRVADSKRPVIQDLYALALRHSRPLHAVLAENLNSTRALLRCLEDGVTVSEDTQCETIRSLFVATRQQVKALAATMATIKYLDRWPRRPHEEAYAQVTEGVHAGDY